MTPRERMQAARARFTAALEAAGGSLPGDSPEWLEFAEADAFLQASRPPLERLQFCGSYERMPLLMRLSYRRDFWKLLGEEWDGCDNIQRHRRKFARLLRESNPGSMWPIQDAMAADEIELLAALPPAVKVWRGCYDHNIDGFSWTLDRSIAEAFPLMQRYWHPDKQPLLVEGRIERRKIAFVKTCRKESEVVTLPKYITHRKVTKMKQREESKIAKLTQ
ncbi:MAG: hypothetical protein U1F41_06870 [Burkholderiales bacterium]